MVATRDINPLELILQDEPAVFGPSHLTYECICLECLLPVGESYERFVRKRTLMKNQFQSTVINFEHSNI